MAEAPGGFDPRRVFLVGGVIAVIIFSVLFFLFRSCGPVGNARNAGYTVIYSNLELKDAATAIARLKELAIPYEIRDDGRAIAVPKEKGDQARLGLAEKNLPAGGVVGWEIFDESKLGATDFDRRIQLIRAISGELSRTIRRIEGVEDVRVQVVIPETKLFGATTAPVTASVLLRLSPGIILANEKINGIIYLVASSVENLQPENVTVVDDSGQILSAKAPAAQEAPALPPPPAETKIVYVTAEAAMTTEAQPKVGPSKEAAATLAAPVQPTVEAIPTITVADRVMLKVQAKKELEQDFSGKAQLLLNRFYPINSVIVKVNLELKPTKEIEIRLKDLKVKRINTIILVDNRLDFTPELKQATYTTVAAAIGYNKKRGDKIIIQRVPFHLATLPQEIGLTVKPKPRPAPLPYRLLSFVGVGLLVLFAVLLVMAIVKQRQAPVLPQVSQPVAETVRPEGGKLDQIRNIADQNPEKVAELLKKWLSE
ncbi:MAG: flagellar basal-body MS-ring/collar protein FliF [Candidatus Margulisbacteria bacterium]|nr:flagellar basal-body MS-ring/collar protein FliF [Candidatus Margulisiibacteriota bacterium]